MNPATMRREIIGQAGYDPEADLENPTGSVFCSHGAGFVVSWDQVEDYMHVESPLKKKQAENEAERKVSAADVRSNGSEPGRVLGGAGGSWTDDKELEAIFERTFGPVRRKNPGQEGVRSRVLPVKRKESRKKKRGRNRVPSCGRL